MDDKDRLLNAFDNFLQLDNRDNRAFQINGFWGTGKTYFVKKYLFKRIRAHGYEPIYVSLSGIGSYDELLTAISRSVFMSSTMLKNIDVLYGFSNFISGIQLKNNNLSKLIKKSLNKFSEILNNGNIILILDDFERSKDTIQIAKYLIRLEEENKNKLVIVSDESKIKKLDKIKEKLICKTFRFGYNDNEVSFQIIMNYLSGLYFDHNDTTYKWSIEATKKLLECSKVINLRIIFDFLNDFKLIFNELKNTKIDIGDKPQLIKTAFVSIYAIEYTIKMGHVEGIKEFKDKHINQTATSIDLFRSATNNLNVSSYVDKEEPNEFSQFLFDNFHKNNVFYKKNAIYSSELFNVIENGYFNLNGYINSVKKYIHSIDPLEHLMQFYYFKEIEVKKLQHEVKRKYLDISHSYSEVHANINYICIIYNLYKKFEKMGILDIKDDVFAQIDNIIIKYVVKDDKNYEHGIIDVLYNEHIKQIDYTKNIKAEIDEHKNELFKINSTIEAKNVIHGYSEYRGAESVFEKFHLFIILGTGEFLNQFSENPKTSINLINNINSYVSSDNFSLFSNGKNIKELEIFKCKLTKKVIPRASDKIVKYNLSMLLELLEKIKNNYDGSSNLSNQ